MAITAAPASWREAPVGIVGMGLIGGSIGLDLRQQGLAVHALVHRPSTAERALQRGLASVVSTDPAVLADCGLVVLALPLDRLLEPDPALLAALPKGAIVTDVGSVKQPVLQRWQPLHRRFVASHPMAGTAQAGVEAGVAGLFGQRPWVATPSDQTDPEALEGVRQLADCLGAHWLCCTAPAHDEAVALISHLPVLVSAALLATADRGGELGELARTLASSGFADTTRVGGGNPQLGRLMASSNREAVLAALGDYQSRLGQLSQLVREGQWDALEAALAHGQQLRPAFVDKP